MGRELTEMRWRHHTIDAYKPVPDDEDWADCPKCGVRPRRWVFDNGLYAKCWCGEKYDQAAAEAESIGSVVRRNKGSTEHYDRDALRVAWNERCAAITQEPAMTPPPRPAFDEALEAVKLALQLCPACGGAGGFPEQVGDEEWGERQCECGAITVPIEAALPTLASEHAALREERDALASANRSIRSTLAGAERQAGDINTSNAALRAEVGRLRGVLGDTEPALRNLRDLVVSLGDSTSIVGRKIRMGHYKQIRRATDASIAARAALAPSPKEADGLSAEERGRRKPPSPETRVDALQDRVHTETGRGRAARTARGELDADTHP